MSWDQIAPHLPAVLGMLAGAMSAAWLGGGWLRRASDTLLSQLILVLLAVLGGVLIAEGLFAVEPTRLVGAGLLPTVLVAVTCGVAVGLVSSLLGVAGGELILPVFILLFGVDMKVAGSMSILMGLPTIAVGLLRHFGTGAVLREGPVWRMTILPLGTSSILGAGLGAILLGVVPGQVLKIRLGLILIWSAWGVFRHLPQTAPAATAPPGLHARVVAHDPEWGLTTLNVDGRTVTVPRIDLPPGSRTSFRIDDRDVTLALAMESGSSALNTLSGRVAGIDPLADGATARVRVAIADVGEIAALVTRRSVSALHLIQGAPVFARFKADSRAMTGRSALVFGLSEAASATAHRLHRDGWRVALAADAPPKVHRRNMAFANVWWEGSAVLAGTTCTRVTADVMLPGAYPSASVPFLPFAPDAAFGLLPWAVAIDARLAKRSEPLPLRGYATLTIGCGPGHVAGETCDLAIETQWGERLGAVIEARSTAALAGEPRAIDGVGRERIVYAPIGGVLKALCDIGDPVGADETIARVGDTAIAAPIGGTLRGILRNGITVETGDKLFEVDPRAAHHAMFTDIGQRPAMIAKGVARAIEQIHPHRASVSPTVAVPKS